MAEYDDGAYYTVHRYDLVVCSRSALGTAANTDTKLLIYRSISKGPSFGTGRGLRDRRRLS